MQNHDTSSYMLERSGRIVSGRPVARVLCALIAAAVTLASVRTAALSAPLKHQVTIRRTGYPTHHRSKWALMWAQQHPAEEAAYLRSLGPRHTIRQGGWAGRTRHGRRHARRMRYDAAWIPPIPSVAPSGPFAAPSGVVSPAPIHVGRIWADTESATTADGSAAGGTQAYPLPNEQTAIGPSPSSAPPPCSAAEPSTATVVASAQPANDLPINPAVDKAAVTSDSTPQPAASVPVVAPAAKPVRVAFNDDSTAMPATGVNLDYVAADINDVLKSLAMQTHTNIVSGADVKGDITISLSKVTLDDALDLITKLSGYQYAKVGSTYVVGSAASIKQLSGDATESAPQAQPATVNEYYHIKYVRAHDLIEILKSLVPTVQVLPAPTSGFDLQAPASADSDTKIEYADTIYAREDPKSASSSSSSDTSQSSGGGTSTPAPAPQAEVSATPDTFGLLLSGTRDDIDKALAIMATVDIRPPQIVYDAKITEINLSKTQDLGFNWSGKGPIKASSAVTQEGTSATTTGSYGPFKIANDLATVSLDAIFSDADTKVLADPNISAVDGQQAAVFIGDTVNYVSSITQSATGENITTASVNVGIKLFVAGRVSDDGYVTVSIHPEVSTISSWLNVPGGGQLPDIASREATTTLRVKDGDYIAIGGLINNQEITQVNKVPGLGDLPFFGTLFRDTEKTKSRDEVVIFVKVSVDKDAG